MATYSDSGTTADTSHDSLSKEEKEALLTKKMDLIRQRNKALTERHKLIEADKKRAEEAGQAVKPSVDSQTLPAEGAPRHRGRGRGHLYQRDDSGPGKDKPKFSGDSRDTSNYEPIVDTTDLANYKSKGRGGSHDRDTPNYTPKNRRNPSSEEENTTFSNNFEYEPIVDMNDLDKRFGPLFNNTSEGWSKPHRHHMSASTQETNSSQNHSYRRRDGPYEASNTSGGTYQGRLKDSEGPPPDPSFNPLADRRRSDRKEDFSDSKRHPRNYGGTADLSRVKQNMKYMRDKERERPTENKTIMMAMTGKERKNHEEWKAEREKYDKERIERQMNNAGSWKRAWDAEKISSENDEQPSSSNHARIEHTKRPAGRIGSGRFDHIDRGDHLQSISTGGLSHSRPQQEYYSQDQRQQQSPTISQSTQSNRGSRVRGRGRGRGRGHVSEPDEDQLVECQKELLMIKIDNTAGDKSVEVKYDDDDEFPVLSSANPKSTKAATTPGRGPTGRTQNHGSGQKPQWVQQQTEINKAPSHKGKSQVVTQETSTEEKCTATKTSQNIPDKTATDHSVDETHKDTVSHSQSNDDSDEWEDCTDEDEMAETKTAHATNNLTLECSLNPNAQDFLPTSPDFMKTPPGHVKVLNWAAEVSPTSPSSQDLIPPQGPFVSPQSS